MRHSLAGALSALLLLSASSVGAQGTVSSQGFGYPPGAYSARVAATGGALAEFDAITPINPAALTAWGASGLYFQYSPEFRTVSSGGASDRSTVIRFPLTALGFVFGRTVLGVSTSTFLDRTWATQASGVFYNSPTDSVRYVTEVRSQGAISDIRLGGGFAVTPDLRVGLGAHVLSGSNRRTNESNPTSATDTLIARYSSQQRISYTGTALSGGIGWRLGGVLDVAASGRVGGTMRSYRNDTTLSRATVPARGGFSLRYTGIGSTTIAARANWDGWSSMQGLMGDNVKASDAWDIGVGAEVRGPRFFAGEIPLRAGVRRRTLPFSFGANEVRETTISAGSGLALSQNHVFADFTVQRAYRTGVPNVDERGWIIGFGFTVRP